MRLWRVVFALVFGLAMVGPEMHQCPVHDGVGHTTSAPASHHDTSSHHDDAGQQDEARCTCPQACSSVGIGVALPAQAAVWSVTPPTPHIPVPAASAVVLPGAPKHLLHFALAPPPALL